MKKNFLTVILTTVLVCVLAVSVFSAGFVSAVEGDPVQSSDVSGVSSEESDSSNDSTSSDTSSDETASGDTSSDGTTSGDASSDESTSSDETTSGEENTSSDQTASGEENTSSDTTSSQRPITSQGAGGGSTFIDEFGSIVDVTVPSGEDGETENDVTEEEIDEGEHFVSENISQMSAIIGKIIWIPILFVLLAIGGLVYVNVFYAKKYKKVDNSKTLFGVKPTKKSAARRKPTKRR